MTPTPPIGCEPGDICLYDTPGDLADDLIKILGGDVAHVEVFRRRTGEGDFFSWACRNGIGVGTYEFRADGLCYILRPPAGLFDPVKAQAYFETVNGEGYSWDEIAAFAHLPQLGLSGPNSLICSIFANRLELLAGVRCFPTTLDDRCIAPFDFRKVLGLKQVWPVL